MPYPFYMLYSDERAEGGGGGGGCVAGSVLYPLWVVYSVGVGWLWG